MLFQRQGLQVLMYRLMQTIMYGEMEVVAGLSSGQHLDPSTQLKRGGFRYQAATLAPDSRLSDSSA